MYPWIQLLMIYQERANAMVSTLTEIKFIGTFLPANLRVSRTTIYRDKRRRYVVPSHIHI